MTPEEIKTIIEQTIDGKLEVYPIYILGAGFISLIVTLLVEYYKTRIRNLATKHDIEILTQKVEDVKIQYAKQMEIFKSNYQLRSLKLKELYDSTEILQKKLIELDNAPIPEMKEQIFQDILIGIKNICIAISASAVFGDIQKEGQSLEEEHNKIVQTKKPSEIRNETRVIVDVPKIRQILRTIQDKLINPQ